MTVVRSINIEICNAITITKIKSEDGSEAVVCASFDDDGTVTWSVDNLKGKSISRDALAYAKAIYYALLEEDVKDLT